MKPTLVREKSLREFPISEGCYILENWNAPDDHALSIARARVQPGVTTALHSLRGTNERYIIVAGSGRVDVGGLQPAEVTVGDVVFIPAGTPQRITNTGHSDLVFYCVCDPPFRTDCYEQLESPTISPDR